MGALGGMEWMIILLAIILLFGAKRLPGLAKGLGQGIKEFRNARIDTHEDKDVANK